MILMMRIIQAGSDSKRAEKCKVILGKGITKNLC